MVKTTDARESHNSGVCRRPRFKGTTIRRILKHRVNTFRVVVGDVVSKESAQMILIEHNDVVDDLSLA